MNKNLSDDLKNFESKLNASFTCLKEIDISPAQKREILNEAANYRPTGIRIYWKIAALACISAAACIFFAARTNDNINFNLDDIGIVANFKSEESKLLDQLWQASIDNSENLQIQEQCALAAIATDFEDAHQGIAVREIKTKEARVVLVTFQ